MVRGFDRVDADGISDHILCFSIGHMRHYTSLVRFLVVMLGIVFSDVASDITNLDRIPCLAQTQPYRIRFADKGQAAFEPGTPLYEQTLATFHADAIARRQRIGLSPVLTDRDRPVHVDYLNQLTSLGVRVLATSNWRNMAIAELDSAQAAALQQGSRPWTVEPIASSPYVPFAQTTATEAALPDCWPPYYGSSLITITTVGALGLHEAGVYGQGAVIGLIDNGFRTSLPPFGHLTIRGEFDAIYGDSLTSNDSLDVPGQDGHGTLVLSVAGGYWKDSIVGVAPAATYLLAKSEDMRWERRIEEDHYALAVEWMERKGADIISSSLGYLTYDSLQRQTSYDELNGSTTTAAQAVNMASTFGVICVTAAGNSGPASRSIITPADADSVVAVGGVLRSGRPWGRSSSGPTIDGRIKPDVAALGAKVPCAGTGEQPMVAADGTSLATPAIAGAFALLRSIYPDVEPWRIRQAVYESGPYPFVRDSAVGHGAPNTTRAAQLLGPGPVRPSLVISSGKRYAIATVFNETPVACTLRVRSVGATEWTSIAATVEAHPHYLFPLDDNAGTVDIEYQLEASAGVRRRTWPTEGVAIFPATGTDISCGAQVPQLVTSVAADALITPMQAVPNVVTDRQQHVRLIGIDGRATAVRVVHVPLGTTSDINWSATFGNAAVSLDVQALASGRYMAVVTTDQGRTVTAPFIVLE